MSLVARAGRSGHRTGGYLYRSFHWWAGLVVLGLVVLMAVWVPVFSSYEVAEQKLDLGASPPMAPILYRSVLGHAESAESGRVTLANWERDVRQRVSLSMLAPEVAQQLTHAGRMAPEVPAELLIELVQLPWFEAQSAWYAYWTEVYGGVPRAVTQSDWLQALNQAYADALQPLRTQLRDGAEVHIGRSDRPPLVYTLTEERHWLGTDEQGRDLLTRLAAGARISLLLGLAATAVATIIGVTYGGVSGLLGGRVDSLMMRVVDVLYGLPFTLLVILLMTVFERSLLLLFMALGAVEWLTMARIVRGQVMVMRESDLVSAAYLQGAGLGKILWRHILPNIRGIVLVYATLTVPAVILLESFLSFLGLGVQAPMSSWGTLIQDGADKMDVYPWLLLVPATCFALTLLAIHFLGDALRDALDPQSRIRW